MTFEQWQEGVPNDIRSDALWRMRAYQLGLFASDLAWEDGRLLLRDARMRAVADQLCRATGNISSNVAAGYSRGTGKDRSRFYDYALGSARESRDWYYKARHVLGPDVTAHRMDLMAQLVKLLIRMSANERANNVRIEVGVPAVSPPSSLRTNH